MGEKAVVDRAAPLTGYSGKSYFKVRLMNTGIKHTHF